MWERSMPRPYYVNSHAGDDGHDGLTAETAWRSLEKANSVVFKPGDSLLMASGSFFNGQFAPKGSGAIQDGKMVPIVLDRFGQLPPCSPCLRES